jgi:hypothetical protein
MLANDRQQLVRVAALTNDVEAGALEQPRQSLAEENVVVGQHDPGSARRHSDDYEVRSHSWARRPGWSAPFDAR